MSYISVARSEFHIPRVEFPLNFEKKNKKKSDICRNVSISRNTFTTKP